VARRALPREAGEGLALLPREIVNQVTKIDAKADFPRDIDRWWLRH
jgi:hypothetical protein